MNSFVKITTLQGQFDHCSSEMQTIAERIKGCATIISGLADPENRTNLGFDEMDAFAAQCISRRLIEFGECWRVAAKHFTTPWLSIDQTDLNSEAAEHAKAWLDDGMQYPHEIAYLLDAYANDLEPCYQAFRTIVYHYSDGDSGTDDCRTFCAAAFVEEELERLMRSIGAIEQTIHRIWNDIPEPSRKGGDHA